MSNSPISSLSNLDIMKNKIFGDDFNLTNEEKICSFVENIIGETAFEQFSDRLVTEKLNDKQRLELYKRIIILNELGKQYQHYKTLHSQHPVIVLPQFETIKKALVMEVDILVGAEDPMELLTSDWPFIRRVAAFYIEIKKEVENDKNT